MSKSIKSENGVEWLDDGRILLIRCPKCPRENWAPAVVSGQCVWCGHKVEPIKNKSNQK